MVYLSFILLEEGYLKMYLKGRAVTMHAPTSVEDYNLSKSGEAPDERLQLEWVYPFWGFKLLVVGVILADFRFVSLL